MMEIIFVLLAISFFMSLGGLAAFFWATCYGQFDDLVRPAEEILCDSDELSKN